MPVKGNKVFLSAVEEESTERLRSWSYYERGQGVALRAALGTLWEAYFVDTGKDCPYLEAINQIPND